MTYAISSRNASTLWILLLTAASTATTLVFACATPFPALAALAAMHMRCRDGLILILLSWAVSQIIGFAWLGYPHDPATIGWAAALACAAVGSVWGADQALLRMATSSRVIRLVAAYVAAFIAFKAIILLWAFPLGGVTTALSPEILARQFVRNGAILIGLLALHRSLVALGVPATVPERAAIAA